MGEVWLAHDELLHREVAVKRIHDAAGAPDAVSLERLMREARLAARLDHPGAVTVYDLLTIDRIPHVVMQYVAGQSLADVLSVAPLGVDRAAEVVQTVAAALAEAHSLGIVHRDVKPANILLDTRGRALLADFGIARSDTDATLTQTGFLIGTPDYLAPELLRDGSMSPASDVYALGATFFAATEGRAPFGSQDDNLLMVLGRILTQPPPRPRNAGTWTGLIMRMLDPDPDTRPTADVVARALAGTTGHSETTRVRVQPVTERSPESAPVSSSPEPADPRTTRAIRPANPAFDATDTLVGAILACDTWTSGWSGLPEDYTDLISDELLPRLGNGDAVDVFLPALFALDPTLAKGFPRRLARSLRKIRAGAVITTDDRVIGAWNEGSWSANHFAVTIPYAEVVQVEPTIYEEQGEDFTALEVHTARWTLPILFSNATELGDLADLLAARLTGAAQPVWADGAVANWRLQDSSGAMTYRPGWPE